MEGVRSRISDEVITGRSVVPKKYEWIAPSWQINFLRSLWCFFGLSFLSFVSAGVSGNSLEGRGAK